MVGPAVTRRGLSLAALACAILAGGCDDGRPEREPRARRAPLDDPYADARRRMVDETLVDRGITDARVIEAMRLVPRHELVPPEVRDEAYDDRALPIGFDLTISQPYIVATMTAAAKVSPGDRVLEIGTGSGYQAAVLEAMGAKVYTMEIVEGLANRTRAVLDGLGLDDIQLQIGDGYYGWPDAAPFDAIIVTAAAPEVPAPLITQVKLGGRIVIPVGDYEQRLLAITRDADGLHEVELFDVMFGPMIGAVRRDP